MTGNAWLRILALAGYAVVLFVHLRHLRGATRRCRAWHAGHLLMALGMIVMFLPTGSMIVPAAAGEAVFVMAATGFGALAAVELGRHGRAAVIWSVAVIDLASMAYMFAGASLVWLTWLLVGWFVLQALGWAAGHFDEPPERAGDRTSSAPRAVREAGRVRDPAGGPGAGLAIVERAVAAPALQARNYSPSIRASLAVMALGMAYMLLAMRFGLPVTSGPMPGM